MTSIATTKPASRSQRAFALVPALLLALIGAVLAASELANAPVLVDLLEQSVPTLR